jgi:hypothetical protein
MAFVGLRVGEGSFSELELQASLAIGRGCCRLLPENLQEESL